MKPHSSRRIRSDADRKSFRSLQTAFTLLVFAIFISAVLITSVITILLYKLGILPEAVNTPLVLTLVTLLACMLIGTILSSFAGRLFINPLRRLIAGNREIRRGNYHVRVTAETPIRELKNLILSFNDMADELESTNLFRNDFINNFSHEFKTPIVSIRGFARQLQRDNEQRQLSDGQRREYTDIIAYESDRLARLSSNILLLTNFENQQIVTDKTEFYLDEQLRHVVLLLEKQWSTRNIVPELWLEEVKYTFNEEMLTQLWLNLIGNAVKFSPDGGTVTVRCRQREDWVIVDVTDQGEGMDAATLRRIFDKFYQGDTSRKSDGNGLGLAIVKRITELAGGEITVTSEPLKGSTFRVRLPRNSQEGAA